MEKNKRNEPQIGPSTLDKRVSLYARRCGPVWTQHLLCVFYLGTSIHISRGTQFSACGTHGKPLPKIIQGRLNFWS